MIGMGGTVMDGNSLRADIIRRGEVAAHLFGWSEAHVAGFAQGVNEALAIPDKTAIAVHSEAYGFNIYDYCGPDMERTLSPFALARIGRFEGFKAVRSWHLEPKEPSAEAMKSQMKFWYLSGSCNFEIDDAECEYIPDFPLSDIISERPAASWIETLKIDHFERLSEGGEGYVDLIVERHRDPCFLADRGDGLAPGIFDGFHRIGASLAVGEQTCAVVYARRLEPKLATQGPRSS